MKLKMLDKIFKITYVVLLIFLVIYVIYMTVVMIMSPKNDIKNRGFIACTKQLVVDLGECESGQIKCVLKGFYQDTICNSAVVFDGFGQWIKGEQKTPWANYVFEPELPENIDEDYDSDPVQDMKNMVIDREFMLQKHQELENAKNRALQTNDNVIISDPETDEEFYDEEENSEEKVAVDDPEQNIDDEAMIGEIGEGDKQKEKIEQMPEPKINSDSDKIAQKAKKEVLK